MLAILPITQYNIPNNSNLLNLKSAYFHVNFYSISKFYINFRTFRKKVEPQSLNILEIIHAEKRGYLNA